MKAFIHIGDSKAGSTTIQRFLQENKLSLAERGLHVANELSTNSVYHNRLAGAVVNNPTGRLARELAAETDLKDSVRRQLETYSTDIVCSYEGFISLDVAADLNFLLKNFFTEIVIVVYLRRPDLAFQSRFNQALFTGWTDNDIAERLRRDRPHLDYRTLLTPWREVFPNIVMRVLERERLVGQSLALDFCDACGIDSHGLVNVEDMNRSISAIGRGVLLEINRDLASLKDERLRNAIRTRVTTILRERYGRRQMILNRSEARELCADYADSYRALGIEFSEDFSMYPRVAPPPPPTEKIERAKLNVIRRFRGE